MNMKTEVGMMHLQVKEHLRFSPNHQKLRAMQGIVSLSQPSQGTNSANTLILDYWPP